MPDTSDIPFREVPYLPQKLNVDRRPDGTIYLDNGQPLKACPSHMLAPLVHWAEHRPDTVWLAERDPENPAAEGWNTLTYAAGLDAVRRLAQGFLDAGAGQDAPLMILSRNSIANALVMYAAMWAGSPAVPVTPAYALLSEDLGRLKYIDGLTQPKFIYVEDGADYQRALDGLDLQGRLVIYSGRAPERCDAVRLEQFMRAPTEAVQAAYDRLTPDTVAKYMMTSGSTGEPKAVINLQGMVSSNARMIRSVWDEERLDEMTGGPQVMCNFLPWSHTYGAHSILHNMLDWGGTLYIDQGAPTPARLPEMLRNLKEVSTTQHTTVPAAWAALATELERDDQLAEVFFRRLVCMAYGGASMGQDIYERIQAVAVRITGERISLSAGYGATETAPTASNVHWPNDRMGLIGLPLPGNTFKMVPNAEKMELRVKGVNVTPGYFRNEEKTKEAFDEEGFYKLGDAVKFVDPDAPERGLAFDGRTAEEFKLANGTWVSAGTVRVQAVAATGGALSDAVVCGLNQNDIRLLGFVNEAWCKRLVGDDLSIEELIRHPAVHEKISAGLAVHNKAHPNVSARVARVLLQATAPLADNGEITEKGYINQSRTQALRQDQVDILYKDTGDLPDNLLIL
ncbi:MAG: feruloyl-CoA synthase [Hyphomonas sp.]|uniref:feruloyl-CoA synthase n=1 Tax=unclassified Hyphomonas TaxID=2630699 RepID=UPI000B690D31|nr:feruloyl-CoA synthase [Hyphomonas sp.]MAH91911.1 feruloyl-CoA synthase [Hyphomonas sp.]OUX89473.1 MAG: feruloyl-CoA synthase [Hyphomonas sp. TMED31]